MRNEKYTRQYERYDYLKKIHICVNCGNEDAEPNCIYCLDCKAKIYERNRKYREKNKEKIKNQQDNYYKNLYHKRKKQGICTKCGKRKVCKNSTTLCIDCYVKQKRRKDKRWNNEILRAERVGFGLCYICAKPRNNHDTLCDNCFNRCSDNMKKINAKPTEKMVEARKEYGQYMFKFKESIFKEKNIIKIKKLQRRNNEL